MSYACSYNYSLTAINLIMAFKKKIIYSTGRRFAELELKLLLCQVRVGINTTEHDNLERVRNTHTQ